MTDATGEVLERNDYSGISPYAYCADDPVNFVDPEGEAWGKVLKIGKKIYKTAKVGKKIDVKDILEGEILDYIDNVNTLLDTDASSFEKSIAAFDLATGFGDEAKWVARTVGVSDAIVDGAKKISKNPFGSKGKPDHQRKIQELKDKASSEMKSGERVETEKIIKVEGSNRRPDVQIIDKDGRTRRIYEAERYPESKRNRLREDEYKRLNIEYEIYPLK